MISLYFFIFLKVYTEMIKASENQLIKITLREKYPNTELFLVRIQGNTGQK